MSAPVDYSARIGTTNPELESILNVCKEFSIVANKAIDTYQENITPYKTERNIAQDEQSRLKGLGYGDNAEVRSAFTGCTDGGIGGGGCWPWNYRNYGGNVANDNGYYTRHNKRWVVACGPEYTTEGASFDGSVCDSSVKNGCIQTLQSEKNWSYLGTADITYYSKGVEGNRNIAICKKSDNRINAENSALSQQQTIINNAINTIDKIKIPNFDFTCQICNSQNFANCGEGSDCKIQQVNNCNQQAGALERTYAQCKAQGGFYDDKEKVCYPKRDCVVGDWGIWESCSNKCGKGTQIRYRTIVLPPVGEGKLCPTLVDQRDCEDTTECPINCQVTNFGEWNECNAKCGSGFKKRERKVIQVPMFGGQICPNLDDYQTCESKEQCNDDCIVSSWSDWEACSNNCGEGTQKRKRTVISPATNAGKSCPVLEETRACTDYSKCGTASVSNNKYLIIGLLIMGMLFALTLVK